MVKRLEGDNEKGKYWDGEMGGMVRWLEGGMLGWWEGWDGKKC